MALQEQEKSPETKDIPKLSAVEEAVLSAIGPADTSAKEAAQLSSGLSAEDLKKQAQIAA